MLQGKTNTGLGKEGHEGIEDELFKVNQHLKKLFFLNISFEIGYDMFPGTLNTSRYLWIRRK